MKFNTSVSQCLFTEDFMRHYSKHEIDAANEELFNLVAGWMKKHGHEQVLTWQPSQKSVTSPVQILINYSWDDEGTTN